MKYKATVEIKYNQQCRRVHYVPFKNKCQVFLLYSWREIIKLED